MSAPLALPSGHLHGGIGAPLRIVPLTSWILPPSNDELKSWEQRTVQFHLPLGLDAYRLVSAGQHAPGIVRMSVRHTVVDTIEIRIAIKYRPGEIASASQCTPSLEVLKDNGRTVQIMVPDHPPRSLYFDISVSFPLSTRSLQRLECKTASFSYLLDETLKNIHFKCIGINTALGIDVKALHADAAVMITSMGLIRGSFMTTKSLELLSRCGSIDATALVDNSQASALVTMATEMGNIAGSLTVSSPGLTQHHVHLTACAKMGNVHFALEASTTSDVALLAQTQCGDIGVRWPVRCSGVYSVTTALGVKPDVVFPFNRIQSENRNVNCDEGRGKDKDKGSVVYRNGLRDMEGRRDGHIGSVGGRANVKVRGKRGEAVLVLRN